MKPKPGDILYIDTQLHLHHGEDDIMGGKAEVQDVREEGKYTWIVFKVEPETVYSWKELEPIQEQLKNEFGDTWAHKKPDLRPQFNET